MPPRYTGTPWTTPDDEDDDDVIGFGGNITGTFQKPWKEPVPEKASRETHIPQYTPDPVFDQIREKLRRREGGISNRPASEDSNGLTNKGMSQKVLDDIRNLYPDWNLPQKPTDLTDQEITDIFRHEFYQKPKLDKVKDIPTLVDTEPKFLDHVFDTTIHSGSLLAGQLLQQSLDETVQSELGSMGQNGERVYDGIIGPKTREAIQKSIDTNQIHATHKAMVRRRRELLRGLKNYNYNPGWEKRLDEFE